MHTGLVGHVSFSQGGDKLKDLGGSPVGEGGEGRELRITRGNVGAKLAWTWQMDQDIRTDKGSMGSEEIKGRRKLKAASEFIDGGLCP